MPKQTCTASVVRVGRPCLYVGVWQADRWIGIREVLMVAILWSSWEPDPNRIPLPPSLPPCYSPTPQSGCHLPIAVSRHTGRYERLLGGLNSRPRGSHRSPLSGEYSVCWIVCRFVVKTPLRRVGHLSKERGFISLLRVGLRGGCSGKESTYIHMQRGS